MYTLYTISALMCWNKKLVGETVNKPSSLRALNCTSEKNACFVFLNTDTFFTLNFLEAQDSWRTEFRSGGTKIPRELGLSDRKVGGGGGGRGPSSL